MTDGTSDLFVSCLSFIGRTYLARNFRSLDDISVFAIGVFSGVGRDAGAQSWKPESSRDEKYYEQNNLALPQADATVANSMKSKSQSDSDVSKKACGLDFILARLNIDRELLADSERLADKYLLFSYIRGDKLAMTWIELENSGPRMPFPVFTARRLGHGGQQLIFHGCPVQSAVSLTRFRVVAKFKPRHYPRADLGVFQCW